MIDRLIAEATECDFKVALETKKPKSWLKSVSAFSNGIGGTLFFGISDDRESVGLEDVQSDAETISRLIKEPHYAFSQFRSDSGKRKWERFACADCVCGSLNPILLQG